MTDLAALVARQIDEAERPSSIRDELFGAYMGEPNGKEIKGRSAVVTSEVFDVVESIAAEIMDMVTMDKTIATFTPTSAEDEPRAQAETDALNDEFWGANNGFETLQTWVKSGLIDQVGYLRQSWVQTERVVIEEYTELEFVDAVSVLAQYEAGDFEGLQVMDLEGATYDEDTGLLPHLGDDMQPELVSMRIKCTKMVDEYEIEPIAQENALLTKRWHKRDLQDVPFFAIEHTSYTADDLEDMGFSKACIERITKEDEDESKSNRHDTRSNDDMGEDETDTLTVYECYTKQDGERLRVWSDGRNILEWANGVDAADPVDSVPIVSWTPIAVPHRHVGRSAAEVVKDLQEINSYLTRSTFDSIAATLFPRPEVDVRQATVHTFTDLANTHHGAPIRTNGQAIQWQLPPNILGATLPLMERTSAAKEERTGVTKLSQGLDADTLNKTAAGQAMLLTQGQKRLKLMARNFAEGVRSMFLRMHRDYRKGNGGAVSYQRNGEWVEENPVEWPERKRMSVSVGTGNGDRAEKQQTLMMVGQAQRELMAAGSPMVTEAHLFETIDRMVQMGGFATADPFFLNPNSPQYKQAEQAKAQQPQEPSPEMVLAQAEATKAKGQGEKAQADAQLALAKIQLDAQKAQQDHERRMLELQLKSRGIDLDEVKVAADIQDANEKQDLAEAKFEDEAKRDRARLALDIAKS